MENNEKLLSAIFNVGRLIKEKLHSEKSPNDFSQSETEVLKFLAVNKDIKMKEIAGYLHIKPSSTTPLVGNLVRKGNLRRISNKEDRRDVYIAITPKGLKALQNKCKVIHKTIANIFGRLNIADKKNLIKILEKIHDKNI